MLALREKDAELVEAEPVETFEPIGHQRAGDQGASPTPADGSAAPSLPTRSDEKREVETVEKERKLLCRVARERH